MERKAVNAPKEMLVAPPLFALSRRDEQYTVETDACDTQAGCVQFPDQDYRNLEPIGY